MTIFEVSRGLLPTASSFIAAYNVEAIENEKQEDIVLDEIEDHETTRSR